MASDARLFVLATLDRLGQAHGHEVAREAAVDRMESWAHVSQGALYSALRKAETDGLITPVRIEQVGRLPQRTVYQLTPDGRAALDEARAAAWDRIGLAPDPFDVALSVSDGLPPAQLRPLIEQRLNAYTDTLAQLQQQLDEVRKHLEPTALAVFEHVILRHQTEVTWHQRLLEMVDGFGTPRASTEGRDTPSTTATAKARTTASTTAPAGTRDSRPR